MNKGKFHNCRKYCDTHKPEFWWFRRL